LAEADDRTIWQYAGSNGFVLVSLDADFAEMAGLLGPPPKVIWLRSGNQKTSEIEALLRNHAELIATFERDGTACVEIY
jgi:predicted nuclease of predicted toxin-antitoxin system